MKVIRCDSAEAAGTQAAEAGATLIREALAAKGRAVIALAAGRSQLSMLRHLTQLPDIDWGNVIVFPLDEYVGIGRSHAASFRRYLEERFLSVLPTPIGAFRYIAGQADDPIMEAQRVSRELRNETVDVGFLGIGENGHIAFNDPPADFDTDEPYLVVDLDERCRQQQVNEGWFGAVNDVPEEAISMSVRQILSSEHLVVTVPEARKAEAVKAALEGKVTPQVPASILQEHEQCQIFLDPDSASMLE